MKHMAPDVSEQGRRFAQAASGFCHLLDITDDLGATEFLRQLQRHLPRLYAAGAELPRVEPSAPEPADGISKEDYARLFQVLSSTLGSYASYWEVYDPSKPEPDEVVAVTLADDLADIYNDLKKGLSRVPATSDESWNDAVWEWQFGWESHWGAHAADAIRAIHWHLDPVHRQESLDWGDRADADA